MSGSPSARLVDVLCCSQALAAAGDGGAHTCVSTPPPSTSSTDVEPVEIFTTLFRCARGRSEMSVWQKSSDEGGAMQHAGGGDHARAFCTTSMPVMKQPAPVGQICKRAHARGARLIRCAAHNANHHRLASQPAVWGCRHGRRRQMSRMSARRAARLAGRVHNFLHLGLGQAFHVKQHLRVEWAARISGGCFARCRRRQQWFQRVCRMSAPALDFGARAHDQQARRSMRAR